MAMEGLPVGAEVPAQLEAVQKAGYDGVQFIEPVGVAEIALCERLGLGRTSLGRVNQPEEAEELASRFADEGQECGTLHVGWGLEDDDEAGRLIEAVLNASEKYDVPLYVETHRATIFQDMWRTVQFVERFPSLRFNGDFSHWYTGQEMVYGEFAKKLAFVAPVMDRVRFVHGRIGNPGCIQVDVGDGRVEGRLYVEHFRAMWAAAFRGFKESAAEGDYICFTPELLAPRIYYARVFPGADGTLREESDRWEQSLVLKRIAAECFKEG
jgi:sugar phosphate isomerase/epimerase